MGKAEYMWNMRNYWLYTTELVLIIEYCFQVLKKSSVCASTHDPDLLNFMRSLGGTVTVLFKFDMVMDK